MASELFRDLVIVNRRLFDEAVASVRAQASYDVDRALREASLWAYRQANCRPKDELQKINAEAHERAERQVMEIQTAAAEKIDILKTVLRERERSIRGFCDQRDRVDGRSQADVAVADQSLTRIRAPVPPSLAEVFGYSGPARFVAFYHEPTVDELIYDDGHASAAGEWNALQLWRKHPTVAAHLLDVNLGDADLEATHWLVIDRENGVLYVALVSTAQAFVQKQHPRPPKLQPSEIAVIQRQTQERQRALDAMLAFLDGTTKADPDSPPPDGA
jgi:hypothetical protein